MRLTEEERRVMTTVAEKFYNDVGFPALTGKTWDELELEEREMFIQGQKWLYAYYKLAFKKGYEKGIENSNKKIEELINEFPFTGGG